VFFRHGFFQPMKKRAFSVQNGPYVPFEVRMAHEKTLEIQQTVTMNVRERANLGQMWQEKGHFKAKLWRAVLGL